MLELLSILCHSYREFWGYLDTVGDMLNSIGIALRTVPASEVALVRKSMSTTSRRYSASTRPPRHVLTQSRNLANVTGDDGRLLPGKRVG